MYPHPFQGRSSIQMRYCNNNATLRSGDTVYLTLKSMNAAVKADFGNIFNTTIKLSDVVAILKGLASLTI